MHKLLLVDGSTTIHRMVELALEHEDVTVSAVRDSHRAFELIESHQPDIILADLHLPNDDGYKVATFVKTQPKYAHIPVVLLRGAFASVDEARLAALGCDGVLAKPLQPQTLIDRVKQLTRPKKTSGEAAPSQVPSASYAVEPTRLPPSTQTASAGPDLTLEKYFDQLDAVFTRTTGASGESGQAEGSRSEPEDHGWPFLQSSNPSVAPGATSDSEASAGSNAEAFSDRVARREKGGTPAPAAPTAAAGPFAIGDELIDRIAQRVLDRVSDRLLRDTVAEILSRLAGCLVVNEVGNVKKVR